ncbi:MAG: queuosine precursor transporter [Clostridia bacterium]|nr:queuosine precursor transporter [Clostridia bacterium]
MNELILILSLVVIYGVALLAYKLFGKSGLYCVSALATVLANVEVIILIKAFGMEQTLGNILFAVTFLITDILSECEGKKSANKAVFIGIFSQIFFLILSQSWLLYKPSESDTAMEAIKAVFSNTPRLVLASLAVYAISQVFDVWLYHKWWNFTQKKFGDKRKFLWLRNNGSTLVSQILNTFLFTVIAFAGTYDFKTLLSIFGSSYIIYVVTTLLDTPVLYLARHISDKAKAKQVIKTDAAQVADASQDEKSAPTSEEQ